jgi:deazaflavin-dependent oxidoreductase (nitroreductase family)
MSGTELQGLESSWNCRLTTTGRKSGEARNVTIWFALGDGRVYLTGSKSNPHWCRNIRANDAVRLEIGGRQLAGRARVIDDPDEVIAIRQRFVDRYLLARFSRPFGGYTASIPVVVELDQTR